VFFDVDFTLIVPVIRSLADLPMLIDELEAP